ncbi:hypothetical protein I551_7712 [Mycobacterium ulcerans str. Harvey]|uniref:Uncharacterized protein n=1 Tax=Mycobacterium ulcerans str. Harvey TaxID=1299332 RepID=A0ABN0QMD3_MYCUL|nr:hypothetical protein I551_7712 [Mycobacterium ulcerans str. Harvey]
MQQAVQPLHRLSNQLIGKYLILWPARLGQAVTIARANAVRNWTFTS